MGGEVAAGTPAYGAGLASFHNDTVLDVRYFELDVGTDRPAHLAPYLQSVGGPSTRELAELSVPRNSLQVPVRKHRDNRRGVEVRPVVTVIKDLSEPPVDVFDVYLRLHLLSRRKIKPHQANLDGIFGLLPTVAWTNIGPVHPETIEALRLGLAASGEELAVNSVDKFPRMTDYVIPSGVRIADASRVRLGAHLAEGTTVMHEGYVNFNAGTLVPCMIEGRISQGVVVDADTDVGRGASIMGTLSGGGVNITRIGKRCLLGANSGLGISLGDDCTVEAGLYLTAGTKVRAPDGTVVKARELSGQNGLLFRRNSQSGVVEAVRSSPKWGGLNPTLHGLSTGPKGNHG